MSTRNFVWIERVDHRIVRIFKSTHGPGWKRAMEAGTLETCPKKDAVGAIRKQIYERSGGKCEWCGKPIAEGGWLRKRMNMHEVVPKGKAITPTGDPGEVSLENGVGLCYDCHINDAHGDRKPQWPSKTFEEIMGEE